MNLYRIKYSYFNDEEYRVCLIETFKIEEYLTKLITIYKEFPYKDLKIESIEVII